MVLWLVPAEQVLPADDNVNVNVTSNNENNNRFLNDDQCAYVYVRVPKERGGRAVKPGDMLFATFGSYVLQGKCPPSNSAPNSGDDENASEAAVPALVKMFIPRFKPRKRLQMIFPKQKKDLLAGNNNDGNNDDNSNSTVFLVTPNNVNAGETFSVLILGRRIKVVCPTHGDSGPGKQLCISLRCNKFPPSSSSTSAHKKSFVRQLGYPNKGNDQSLLQVGR